MKHYKVEEKTINDILNYLAGRPYHEVFQLIPQLQLPKIEEIKEEEEKKEGEE